MIRILSPRSAKGRKRAVSAMPAEGNIYKMKETVSLLPQQKIQRQWSSRSKKLMQSSIQGVNSLSENVNSMSKRVNSVEQANALYQQELAEQMSSFQDTIEFRCAVHVFISGASFLIFNSSLQQHAKTLVAVILISGAAFVFLRFYLGYMSPMDGATQFERVNYMPAMNKVKHHRNHSKSRASYHRPSGIKRHTAKDIKGMQFNYLQDSGISFEPVFAALSEEQKAVFTKFKETFAQQAGTAREIDQSQPHVVPDDFNLLRFLKADKFDSAAALKRLLATIRWRQQNEIDDLPTNPPECLAYYKTCREKHYVGHDPQGRPLVVEKIGQFFSNPEIPKSLKMSEWLKCYSYDMSELFNELRKSSVREGRAIQEVCFIGDLQGLKFYQMYKKLKFMRLLTREVDVHFPEIAGVVFLINAPSFVAKLWTMIQHWLDPCLASKIRIRSGVPLDEMIEAFGEEVIPEEYGGMNKGAMQ